MRSVYHAGSRQLQDRFDTRRARRLVQRSRFVPKAECETPVPDWKTREWSND